jgi:hypothetical protein
VVYAVVQNVSALRIQIVRDCIRKGIIHVKRTFDGPELPAKLDRTHEISAHVANALQAELACRRQGLRVRHCEDAWEAVIPEVAYGEQ